MAAISLTVADWEAITVSVLVALPVAEFETGVLVSPLSPAMGTDDDFWLERGVPAGAAVPGIKAEEAGGLLTAGAVVADVCACVGASVGSCTIFPCELDCGTCEA